MSLIITHYMDNTIKLQLHIFIQKNTFAEVSKNITRYRSENNFVRPLK